MLKRFDIDEFRTFKRLRIERLARVNLIVGRNNVGKTMLLEALRLFGHAKPLLAVHELLQEREEFATDSLGGDTEPSFSFETLFHGRHWPRSDAESIRLGPSDDPQHQLCITASAVAAFPETTLGLVISRGTQRSTIPFGQIRRYAQEQRGDLLSSPAFLSAGSMDNRQLGRFWDKIALKPAEEQVLKSLQLICPVDRVTLVSNPIRPGERIAMARMGGAEGPLPLRSLGDGVVRIFELALTLQMVLERSREATYAPYGLEEQVFAGIPMLLIDEIENGIHYTAMPDVWRFLLRAARIHDLQIFATTHSWDCIEALQQAVYGEPEDSASLIRLEPKGNEHRAVIFDQNELPIVTKQHIEVR